MNLLDSVNLDRADVLLTSDLLAAGYNDKSIALAVRAGKLHRLRHGAYTFRALWEELDAPGRRMLVAHATLRKAKSDAVLSHTSAADLLGAPVWDLPETAHVTRLDTRAGRRSLERAQHRGILLPDDVVLRDGVPLTNGTRTALDITTIADVEHSLVVVNGLLNLGETSKPLLHQRASAMTHHPHSLRTNLVVDLADGRCESAAESRTLYLCWSQHVPMPETQYRVYGAGGNLVARLDFAWPERKAYLEFDGRIKYVELLRDGETAADVLLREKKRQQLVRGLTGWDCIRITWADLYHPQRTAARIVATLNGRPWAA